jgi:hypothetical protein
LKKVKPMNLFSPVVRLGWVLLFSTVGMAQTTNPGNAALLGAAQGQGQQQQQQHQQQQQQQLGGLDNNPAGAQTGFQGANLQQPIMAPRADFGAQDAQRNNLSPLRALKLQIPSQFQKFVQESTG